MPKQPHIDIDAVLTDLSILAHPETAADSRLTTNRLAKRLALHLGETQGSARGLLNLVLAEIRCALLAGRPVTLDGLGTLAPRTLPPRHGIGPRGPWSKPAGVKVTFKAARGLKEDLEAELTHP